MFMYHYRHYLHPTFFTMWKDYLAQYSSARIQINLFAWVEAERQTPRDTSTYGSYTTMDLDKNIIVDVQLVHVCNIQQ